MSATESKVCYSYCTSSGTALAKELAQVPCLAIRCLLIPNCSTGITSADVVDKTSQTLRDQLRAALTERDDAISAVAVNKNNVQIELHDRQRVHYCCWEQYC